MTFVLLCWITTYPYTALRASLHLQPYLGTLSVSAHQYIHVYTDRRRTHLLSCQDCFFACVTSQQSQTEHIIQSSSLPEISEVIDAPSLNTLKQYFTTDAWMTVVQRGKIHTV